MKFSLIVLAATLSVVFGQSAYIYNDPRCGHRPLKTVESDDKVVGGLVSIAGDHPWQVALIRGTSFICGGSIINEYTVMTAAHCTTLTSASYQVVRTHTRSPIESWAQTRQINRLVNHPSYSGSTYNNDISLLFTREPFSFRNIDQVDSLCISEINPADNTTAYASGWGSTASGGAVQNVLRDNKMPITQESSVRVQYGNSYLKDTMIAAAYQGDGLDTCQGDSGGPLSVSKTHHVGIQTETDLAEVGIVSWGYGCGGIGIYTRVSAYIGWIRTHVLQWFADNNITPLYPAAATF